MKKTTVLAVLIVFIFTLCFTACDDFFSKSKGNFRTYDPAKIDINAGNVNKWLRAAVGNPALSEAITKAILIKLQNPNIKPADKAALLKAGLRLAVESSGLGISLISHAAGLLGDIDNLDEDAIKELLSKIQKDFDSGGGLNAAAAIAQMVNGSITTEDDIPKFDPSYSDTIQPGEVAEAVMVLVLGLLNEQELSVDSPGDEWNKLGDLAAELGIAPDDSHATYVVYSGDNPNALALAAYLNLIADNSMDGTWDNPLTNAIFDSYLPNHH